MRQQAQEASQGVLEALGLWGVVWATTAELLPPVAALLAIIWSTIRIYEWARVRIFGRRPVTESILDAIPDEVVPQKVKDALTPDEQSTHTDRKD